VYCIIEEQCAAFVERVCVALFDFGPYLTSACAKFQKQLVHWAVKKRALKVLRVNSEVYVNNTKLRNASTLEVQNIKRKRNKRTSKQDKTRNLCSIYMLLFLFLFFLHLFFVPFLLLFPLVSCFIDGFPLVFCYLCFLFSMFSAFVSCLSVLFICFCRCFSA
jgi:hypothetical protein